jgi:radical SAM-linked protein
MQANYVQRHRFRFSKSGPTQYIGHLDLARTLERAFNRAQVPVAYTQGFNRRPRMQFASALPLGFTSRAELADVWLVETMPPTEMQSRLAAKMAPGITILEVWEVPLSAPNLQTITRSAEYEALLPESVPAGELAESIANLLAAAALPRERKGKPYDLRPLVETLLLVEEDKGAGRLKMRLTLLPGQTGRPDEVLAELGFDPLDIRVERTAIHLAEDA